MLIANYCTLQLVGCLKLSIAWKLLARPYALLLASYWATQTCARLPCHHARLRSRKRQRQPLPSVLWHAPAHSHLLAVRLHNPLQNVQWARQNPFRPQAPIPRRLRVQLQRRGQIHSPCYLVHHHAREHRQMRAELLAGLHRR
jgi:hypothetical protein